MKTGKFFRGLGFCLAAMLGTSAAAAPLYQINLHNHVNNGNNGTSGSSPVSGGPYHTTFNYTDGYGSGAAAPEGVESHTELYLHPWIYGVNGDVSMRSTLRFDDVTFTDLSDPSNTSLVPVSINLDLNGVLTYAPTSGTPAMRGVLSAGASLAFQSSAGSLEAWFGGAGPSPGGSGFFAGESGESLSGIFTTDTVMVPLNTELTLDFWVRGRASVLEAFYSSTDRARVFADIGGALAQTPFNLPNGIAATSVQGGIDQQPAAVPAPTAAWLMLAALALFGSARVRRTALAR